MANGITTAFWSVTINNFDERDIAIMERGYPDYCRKVVWTIEEGKQGTPHIQAFVKLQRQQRMSFVRKLFPGGHFKPLTSDEYVLNTETYVQKNDETTRSAHVQVYNDPLHTIESVIKRVVMMMLYGDDPVPNHRRHSELKRRRLEIQQQMVIEDYRFAKVFVSATYKRMWEDYGFAIFENIWNAAEAESFTHTHTHTHSEKKISREGGITNDAAEGNDESEGEDAEESGEEEDGEDYTEGDGSSDETDTESGDYAVGEDSAW